ncbi:unnamed protein product [Microthlaspi erraticum]|uniref:F-box domain-containing protein n=1 Tax=Microthlaspi erraticum TaxID=1685480 RepID=A0A6D2ISF3_9BRAS|nr:unnamed protein product [Microthlaspi erraticum]
MKISDLPYDLESEILARVSAKSLWKSQTTCKRWYSLLRDENFITRNKKLSKPARESILQIDFGVCSTGDDLHGIHNRTGVDPSIEFPSKLCYLRKDPKKVLKISQIYHCDGLILCSTKRNNWLVIMNPCTGETRLVKPRTFYREDDTYALGYVNSNKPSSSSSPHSHKILRCFYHENEQSVKVAAFEMYDLSSGSWRVLDDLTGDYREFRYGMSLKGNTYWAVGDLGTGLFLMKFDFTTEKFVRLSLPFQSFPNAVFAPLSVVKDEKLSVLDLDIQESSCVMKIWVTNKVDDEDKDLSWRSDCVLEVDLDKFELPSVVKVSSFLLDEENKVAVCCDLDWDRDDENRIRNFITRIYIVGEDMYKQVYKETTRGTRFKLRPLLLTYVPSQTREIKPRTCYGSDDTYALGYVNDSKSFSSYKILRCSCYKKDKSATVAEFEMYDLSSGSWRFLYNFTRNYRIFCDGMSLKGNTYWVYGDKETGLFLMKFDFTTEKFVRLSLPFQSFNLEDTAALSVVKDKKLSVLHQNIIEFSNVMRIWVTNKVDEADKELS